MSLHSHLISLHRRSGLTAREAAEKIGVHELTFSRWVRYHSGMRLSHAEKLYKLYTGKTLLQTIIQQDK